MARELTEEVVGIISGSIVRPAIFCEFRFSAGTVRFWSGLGEITFNENVYTGSGDLGTISEITESEVLKASGVTFNLSGVPSSIISASLGQEYSERLCFMHLAFFDDEMEIVSEPYLLFSGRMDIMSIEENGEFCSVSLSAENRLIDLERPSARRYTDEDQQHYFPGDKGLAYVTVLNDGRQLKWG